MSTNENLNGITVCVDLDGVLNTYDAWVAPEHFHPIRPGAAEFLQQLNASGYRVVVFTVRYHGWVEKWLEENNLAQFVDHVTDRKIPAHVYLDDRAVCFQGDFREAMEKIVAFKPHWEKFPKPVQASNHPFDSASPAGS